MKVIKQLIVLSLILLTGISCSSELDSTEFMEWVKHPENGLHRTKTLSPYEFDAQLKPIAYIALQEKGSGLKKSEFDQLAEAEKDIVYIDLQVGLEGSEMDMLQYKSEGLVDYKERLYYYSFRFEHDLYLEQNGQKIPCSMYHFERSFSLKGSRRFLLGFEVKDHTHPVTLVINSEVLGLGVVKIKFDNTQELPAIRWSSES